MLDITSSGTVLFILAHWVAYKFLYTKKHFGLFWMFLFALGISALNLADFTTYPEYEIVGFIYILLLIVLMIINFLDWRKE